METHELRGSKERERSRDSSHFFARPNEEQHCVAAVYVIDEALSGVAGLACLRLGFPVQQLTTDGVILIHCARRKLLLGFLECHEGREGLDPWEVEPPNSGYAGGLERCSPKSCFYLVAPVSGMQFKQAWKRQTHSRASNTRRFIRPSQHFFKVQEH